MNTISEEKNAPTEHDAILLVKKLVNSDSLAQPSLTALPSDFASNLKDPVEQLPRNLLSDRSKKEFFITLLNRKFGIFLRFCHT